MVLNFNRTSSYLSLHSETLSRGQWSRLSIKIISHAAGGDYVRKPLRSNTTTPNNRENKRGAGQHLSLSFWRRALNSPGWFSSGRGAASSSCQLKASRYIRQTAGWICWGSGNNSQRKQRQEGSENYAHKYRFWNFKKSNLMYGVHLSPNRIKNSINKTESTCV